VAPPPGSPPVAVTTPVIATVAPPRCRIDIDGRQRIWVDGWETRLATPRDAHVSTFATGDRLLFAWATEGQDPRGSHTLYRATCDGPPAVDEVVTDPHVDFGHAALLGSTLVVTSDTGAAALDLATGTLRPITTAPACQRDVVVQVVHGGAIAVRRGGACHAPWSERPLVIEDPLGAATVRDMAGISALAAASDGTLYVARGDACADARPAAAVHDAIWRSRDAGATWTKLGFPGAAGDAIDQLFADGGHLIAHAARCGQSISDVGSVVVSEDAGASWRIVAHDVSAISLVSSTRHLVAMFGEGRGARWSGTTRTSLDGGASWLDGGTVAPRLGPVTVNGEQFYPTTDGLVRAGPRGLARVFPVSQAMSPSAPSDCDVRIDPSRRIWVNGYAIDPRVPFATGLEYGVAPLAIPYPPGRVLFSYGGYARRDTRDGANVLWQATCGDPPVVSEVFSASDARFGWSVLAGDGRTLYFAGEAGIAALDLVTRRVHGVTHPAPCPYELMPQHDYPIGLEDHDRRLVFVRSNRCGYEGEAQEYTVRASLDPAGAALANPVPVVVADAAGTLYASEGIAPCAGTPDTLWRSQDGERWTKLTASEFSGPITLLLADATHPGRLVAQSGWCHNGGRGDWGGWAYSSDDGGATWREIDPAPARNVDGAPYLDVDIVGGDAHHLVIAFSDHTVESTDGKTWKRTSRVLAPHRGGPVSVRGDTYHPTATGIVRVRAGQPPVHLQLPR
jgi:hypothetical protein